MSSRRYTFIFSAVGTMGDLLPMIALGKVLVARGHECLLLCNEPAAAEATKAGMTFVPIAPRQENNIVNKKHNFGTYLFRSYEPTLAFFRERSFDPKHTVVINHNNVSASMAIAERYGLPVVRTHTAPQRVYSATRFPWPYAQIFNGRLRHVFRKYGAPTWKARNDADPFVLDFINAHRSTLDLEPIRSLSDLDRFVGTHIAFFPDWFCGGPAPDWPADFVFAGFPLPASERDLSVDVVEHVKRCGPPLVFTPGTGIPNVTEFFTHAANACRALDMPGIFLSPFADSGSATHGAKILQLPYVDLDLLLPHSALLVHHGGIGTTARAIEAGIPQIVLPIAYDQPDNGRHVTMLGVGGMIERDRLTEAALAELAVSLVRSTETRLRLVELQARVKAHDGITAAADVLESAL